MDAFIMLFVLIFVILFYWLPCDMARTRGRSVFGWLLLTLIFSPFMAIIALLVLGRADNTSEG